MKGASSVSLNEVAAISVVADFADDRVWILPRGIDGFALAETDMRELAAAIVRACDELAARRTARVN